MLRTWYTRSRLHEGKNTAYITLYAGTEKLLDWQQPNPQEMNADWSAPTWIGQTSDGKHRWPTRLGEPQFYNTALSDNPAATFDRLQDVQQLACQPQNP
ncbi:MAG: hypothetical protein IPK95_03015 [Cellvibrionales bacterium]|nr:hypothetical protein [Cellvibrionales bacterium]